MKQLPMHVLVTADTIGGVWTYARELVTGLARKGVRVTLVSFGDIPEPSQTQWLEELRGVDFHPTAFKLEWMQGAEADIAASSEYLRKIVDEVRPDLLHLNQFCYGSLKVDIPKVVVAHSDVVSWWVAVKAEEPKPDEWTNWYHETVGEGLAKATAVVAPSRWMLQCVELFYGSPREKRVIYNGRTPTLFNPYIKKDNYVLSVGRLWDGGKQASLLAQCNCSVPICVAGAEKHADQALRTGDRFSGGPQLVIKGQQTEAQLRHLYARASIYAATSRYEPFGLAPLEAALSRCALVCNDIPSFREIWEDAAFFFKPNDAQSLAKAIDLLSRDRELRLRYANMAYNRARQRFVAGRMAGEYIALYRTLVGAEAAAA